MHASNVDINDLKKLAWSGIPYELRPMSWQLLLGYIPPNAERRVATLARKRKEYMDGVSQVFGSGLDQTMWHQISIDVPRTNPHIKLYGFYATQRVSVLPKPITHVSNISNRLLSEYSIFGQFVILRAVMFKVLMT